MTFWNSIHFKIIIVLITSSIGPHLQPAQLAKIRIDVIFDSIGSTSYTIHNQIA